MNKRYNKLTTNKNNRIQEATSNEVQLSTNFC